MFQLTPALQSTLFVVALFMVVGNPVVYGVVDKILGRPILRTPITQNGIPTRTGIVVHAVVFGLVYYAFLHMK